MDVRNVVSKVFREVVQWRQFSLLKFRASSASMLLMPHIHFRCSHKNCLVREYR